MTYRSLGICLLWALPLAAQESPSTELEARLPELEGAARARAHAELTKAHRSDDPSTAITHGNAAMELFPAHPDPELEAATLNHMAWAYMIQDDYDRAIAHAERGRTKAEQHDDLTGMSLALNNLGVIARRRGDPANAVEFF